MGVLFAFVLAGGIVGYTLYQWIQGPNTDHREDYVIFIPSESNFDQVVDILEASKILTSRESFYRVANWMKYPTNIKPGKYTIKPSQSNRQLIGLLRAGRQTPVELVINNVRTISELAGKIANQLEVDSADLIMSFTSSKNLANTGLDSNNILSLFIPNTYEVFWTARPEELVKRFIREHEKFWSKRRRSRKAKDLQLTQAEVYTLASIVEKETQENSERPTVARLYLNRLDKRIPLQADPTVVFATGLYELRRVLLKHLKFDSPYNTYLYSGLPPGPIYMPSIASIDAILNADEHNYLYMCAKPDQSGRHNFAATLAEHNINAKKYRRWLDQRGIR